VFSVTETVGEWDPVWSCVTAHSKINHPDMEINKFSSLKLCFMNLVCHVMYNIHCAINKQTIISFKVFIYTVSVDNMWMWVHVFIMEHELVYKRLKLFIILKTYIWNSFT
jgi:hypothetical protein